MASSRLLGLPPISPELKSITPYLQRAEELRTQEPVVAYWCAYYAAQVGISAKAKDVASRDLLLSLLGTLEQMKQEIGPNDAIDMEAASSAYVENFALKVFAMADNEDRNGRATRSTAKKFLAAASFLEVLKTFPKTEFSDSNADKIRYAKWKAADISKAYREGRKPAPGPIGSEPEFLPRETLPANNSSTATLVAGSPPKHMFAGSPPKTNVISSSPPRGPTFGSPPHIKHASPPHPQIDSVDIAHANATTTPRRIPGAELDGHLATGSEWGARGEVTPGSWSTAATPGTTHGNTPLMGTPSPDVPGHDSYVWSESSRTRNPQGSERRRKSRSGSGSSSGSGGNEGILKSSRAARASDELEGKITPPMSSSPPKKVTFTPSVVGGTTTDASSPVSPGIYQGPGSIYTNSSSQPPYSGGSSPTNILPASGFPPVSPPHFTPSPPRHNIYAPPAKSPPRSTHMYAPPPPPVMNVIPPVTEVELTPSVIAKAQKHCRFAISALDYEDADQARKELRAALTVLGG